MSETLKEQYVAQTYNEAAPFETRWLEQFQYADGHTGYRIPYTLKFDGRKELRMLELDELSAVKDPEPGHEGVIAHGSINTGWEVTIVTGAASYAIEMRRFSHSIPAEAGALAIASTQENQAHLAQAA